jgi:redox-sensitive bicupin YhaK (pirin superfamily)
MHEGLRTPNRAEPIEAGPVQARVRAREHDIGAFTVGRLLPVVGQRAVGPFVFFDHMGPAELAPGEGMDVRPHPHIGLSTLTWLFSGEIEHRDSLGVRQRIRPGEINWMTAGRGVVHSERTAEDVRARGQRLHGLQVWIALPAELQDDEPSFQHFSREQVPETQLGGLRLRVIAGRAFALEGPVSGCARLFYVEVTAAGAARLQVPPEHAERAVYVVEGGVRIGEQAAGPRELLVLRTGVTAAVELEAGTRVVVFGGAPLDGPRHVFWNFVATDRDLIEQAKADWASGSPRFPPVPGDPERAPLPE